MVGADVAREQSDLVGWRAVATAVHDARRLTVPALLTIVASETSPMWIDLSTSRYFWESALTELPDSPGSVTVYSQPIEEDNPPYPWVAWRPMDPLLWEVGRRAFHVDRADWMGQGDRYALQRWPNLTEISHSPEEIRMIATLANEPLSAHELGLLAGTDERSAGRVLDMLSLLDAVRTESGPTQPPSVTDADDRGAVRGAKDRSPSFGFFSRLRDRFEGGGR